VGIEPTYKGFADLSLTTWVPRPGLSIAKVGLCFSPESARGVRIVAKRGGGWVKLAIGVFRFYFMCSS